MSFTRDVKNELLTLELSPCCAKAQLAAITADVPRGATPEQGLDAVRLLALANGIRLRQLHDLGLRDDQRDMLLIDWRAPAAEPFFAATQAHPQGVTE